MGWDAYRDEGPYQVSWSLPAGKGNHHVLRGRSINSVAVSPAGDLIAISVATALSIGNIQDSIYVFRASDGREVFRRYLPRYYADEFGVSGQRPVPVFNRWKDVLLLRVSSNQ